jgi:hypothetical protein
MSIHTSTNRSTRARPLARRRPSGQALVTTLLFGAVACLAMLFLFNGALLANTKTQLQNAADAGAYSAAVLQARDHNFSAYTNRAMIANQVAVAQQVSMESFLEDAESTNDRANDFVHDTLQRGTAAFAPAWDAAINVPVGSIRSAATAIDTPLIVGLNLLIDVLDEAQEINHLGTMAEMVFVADEVVKKNDPQAGVTTSAFMVGDAALKVTKWGNDYTKRYTANDNSKQADRFADAVVSEDSLDSFTPNRTSAPLAAWGSTVKGYLCPGAAVTFTWYAFRHGGGTILSENKRRWLALDATDGSGSWSCYWTCPIFGLCGFTLPFVDTNFGQAPYLDGGHGGAQVGSGSGYGEAKGYKNNVWSSWGYGFALIAEPAPANYRYWIQGPDATLDSNGGIQDHYRDMADTNEVAGSKKQTPEDNGGKYPVTIEVERTASTIRTTTKFMTDNDQLKLEDGMKHNTMRTIASAHSYFYRPKQNAGYTRSGWRRGDNQTEYENLFSPYWQARLAPSDPVEQAASLLAQ